MSVYQNIPKSVFVYIHFMIFQNTILYVDLRLTLLCWLFCILFDHPYLIIVFLFLHYRGNDRRYDETWI